MPEEPHDVQRELRKIRLILMGQWLLFALISCAVAMHFWAESLRPPVIPGQELQAVQAELRSIREELAKQRNKPGLPQVVPVRREEKVEDFMRAAERGQVGHVEESLKEGIHVNERDSAGQTALMRAAAKGQAGVVTLLLDRKAIITEQDDRGQTAATKAAQSGQRAIILLLKDRFNQNEVWALRDKDGQVPLFHAAMVGNSEIVGDLLYKGDGGRDNTGKTALMYAAEGDHLGVVKVMLAESVFKVSPAYVNLKDKAGKTALQLAQEKGHTRVVELLKK